MNPIGGEDRNAWTGKKNAWVYRFLDENGDKSIRRGACGTITESGKMYSETKEYRRLCNTDV